ncbi:MAG: hypothetical protein ACHQK8_04360 [Bacteroidia bacterium]
MKTIALLLFPLISFFGCFENSSKEAGEDYSLYTDSGRSSIQIDKLDSAGGWKYKTIETNYKIIFLKPFHNEGEHYLAKYITVKNTSTKNETQNVSIEIELKPLSNPKAKTIFIKQHCDDLSLEHDIYYAVKHGCCGGPDVIRIFDYNNRMIVEGEDKIITANIPNSPINMYVALMHIYGKPGIWGILNISFNGENHYHILLKTEKPLIPDCDPGLPHLTVNSESPKDGFIGEKNQYDLWSLEKIKAVDLINHISVKLRFECDENIDLIEVPIVNGMPFGLPTRQQEVVMKRKKG